MANPFTIRPERRVNMQLGPAISLLVVPIVEINRVDEVIEEIDSRLFKANYLVNEINNYKQS